MPAKRIQRSHVVISAPSEWGQLACDHLLKRAVAHGGKVTIIIPRKHQGLFSNNKPKIDAWKKYTTLKKCFDDLKASKQPIDYCFDDHLNKLAAVLIVERKSNTHLTVGYVTSSAEDHYLHTEFLSRYCERVLVEKPISRLYYDIRPDKTGNSLFSKLVKKMSNRKKYKCNILFADHFLFRLGITNAWNAEDPTHNKGDITANLKDFLRRHKGCNLQYNFCFEEPPAHDDPAKRPGAYQDGSIMDVLLPHGMGPVATLILPGIKYDGWVPKHIDFFKDMKIKSVRTWRAMDDKDPSILKIPVFSETAAEMKGELKLPSGKKIDIALRSAKGCREYNRYFMITCSLECCNNIKGRYIDNTYLPYFGVSLGQIGHEIYDYGVEGWKKPIFIKRDGGYRSDSPDAISEAANAQAAMLDAILAEKLDTRFLDVDTACQLIRLGLRVQGEAFLNNQGEYIWGTLKEDEKGSYPNVKDFKANTNTASSIKKRRATEEITSILGVGDGPGQDGIRQKVVTLFGPEGKGNTSVALSLKNNLIKKNNKVVFVDIPRDESWCSEGYATDPNNFPYYSVMEKLYETKRKFSERTGNSQKFIILLNGLDRLPSKFASDIIRFISKELKNEYRFIIVTNKWEQATGFVVRTDELAKSDEFSKDLQIETLKERLEKIGWANESSFVYVYTKELKHEMEDLLEKRSFLKKFKEMIVDVLSKLERPIKDFATGNSTIEKQLTSYLLYVALPRIFNDLTMQKGRRWYDIVDAFSISKAGLDKLRVNLEPVLELLKEEIECLSIPKPLSPDPEATLDRIANLCIDALSIDELRVIRRLSLISTDIPEEVIKRNLPALMDSTSEERMNKPIHALFDRRSDGKFRLYPRVRRAVLKEDAARVASLINEMDRRRLMLSLDRMAKSENDKMKKEVKGVMEKTMTQLLHGVSLEKLNLDGSKFEEYYMERANKIEWHTIEFGKGWAVKSLLDLFDSGPGEQKNNMSLLGTARMLRLKGWVNLGPAGTEPSGYHNAVNYLRSAHHIAEFCKETSSADVHNKEIIDETLALTTDSIVWAGLIESYVWHHIFGLKSPPRPRSDMWEAYVKVHKGKKPGWNSLWTQCGVDQDTVRLKEIKGRKGKGCNLGRIVRARGVRALALYYATRPEVGNIETPLLKAARLCLDAAELNVEATPNMHVRNILEAAVLLKRAGNKEIKNEWDIKCKKLTPANLRVYANKLIHQNGIGDKYSQLRFYVDLLSMFVDDSIYNLKKKYYDEMVSGFYNTDSKQLAVIVNIFREASKEKR